MLAAVLLASSPTTPVMRSAPPQMQMLATQPYGFGMTTPGNFVRNAVLANQQDYYFSKNPGQYSNDPSQQEMNGYRAITDNRFMRGYGMNGMYGGRYMNGYGMNGGGMYGNRYMNGYGLNGGMGSRYSMNSYGMNGMYGNNRYMGGMGGMNNMYGNGMYGNRYMGGYGRYGGMGGYGRTMVDPFYSGGAGYSPGRYGGIGMGSQPGWY